VSTGLRLPEQAASANTYFSAHSDTEVFRENKLICGAPASALSLTILTSVNNGAGTPLHERSGRHQGRWL